MRLGLTRLFNAEPDLTVCGEASDARQALSLIAVTAPQLIVADIAISGLSIVGFLTEVRARRPDLPVLILSNYDEILYAERLFQAGARGYLMKREGAATLLAAVRQVLAGRPYLSQALTAVAFEALGRGGRARNGNSVMLRLSDRELEVLWCLGKGKTTREAAAELGISAKTVEAHRLSLGRKLGLRSAAELIRFAVHWDDSGAPGLPAHPVVPASAEHSA